MNRVFKRVPQLICTFVLMSLENLLRHVAMETSIWDFAYHFIFDM